MEPLSTIDLKLLSDAAQGKYTNILLNKINDHVARISIMTEPYFWHYHPNSDESFLVLEGILLIELEDRLIELGPGQLFTIPKNVLHKTKPKGDRSVNITFELEDIQTIEANPDKIT